MVRPGFVVGGVVLAVFGVGVVGFRDRLSRLGHRSRAEPEDAGSVALAIGATALVLGALLLSLSAL